MPEPTIGSEDVLIAVGAASVCGSDRALYDYDAKFAAVVEHHFHGLPWPLIAGHEVAGTVIESGSAVTHLAAGQRVAVESHLYCGRCFNCRTGNAHLCDELRVLGFQLNGAFAEQLSVPAAICFPLPDSVSLEAGALFEPVGVAVHAIQRAGDLAGASVLVSGCGPIGLFIVELARLFGAANVVALEINASRRQLAESLGAVTYDPTECDAPKVCRDISARRGGVDVAFEVAGVASALPTLFACTRAGGTVVAVGAAGAVELDVFSLIAMKYITLTGVYGRRLWETWELLLSLVESRRLDVEAMITHHFGFEEFDHAMDVLQRGAGKVIIAP